LQAAAVIAQNHHEKFDGTGYPFGLKNNNIPLMARIVALADVFDALTSERPYKEAWEWQKAVDYIIEQKGTHFDPELVDVFLTHIDEARAIQRALADVKPSGLAG
jgi:HD-GYP domain-containing protein (c-di-GMP phosphodiesterase class II)